MPVCRTNPPRISSPIQNRICGSMTERSRGKRRVVLEGRSPARKTPDPTRRIGNRRRWRWRAPRTQRWRSARNAEPDQAAHRAKLTFGAASAEAGRIVVRVFLEAEYLRRDVGGEAAAQRVVLLQAVVVARPFGREPVLGACQFIHQARERRVRLELRVVLDDDEQTSQRAGFCVRGRNTFGGRGRARPSWRARR